MWTQKAGMIRNLISALITLCICSTSFAQSKVNFPIPEYYGTYAVAGRKLISVDSSSNTQATTTQVRFGARAPALQACQGAAVVASVFSLNVAELPSDVQFIVFFQPSGQLSPMVLAQDLKLQPVKYVRNVQVTDCIKGSPVRQGTENAWDFLAGPMEMKFKPVPGQQEMVVAVPASTLPSGVYVLSKGALQKPFMFAVSSVVDAERPNCIDVTVKYNAFVNMIGGAPSETPTPCTGDERPSRSVPANEAVQADTVPASQSPASCNDYDSCVRGGHEAFRSSDLAQALAAFLKAGNTRPNLGLPWFWAGNTYLVMNRIQDATGAWDKALALQFPLPFSACRERGIQQCEIGALHVGANSISFLSRGQIVLDAPLSQITVIGTTNHRNQGYISFGLAVEGKKYNFDFLPFGITCPELAHVNCPRNGMEQQIKISDYVSQVIPKLASGALKAPPVPIQAGTTPATPVPTTLPKAAPCGQALTLGYSILANGHLYSAKSITSAGGEQIPVFFDEKGGPVQDSVLVHRLASGDWTRENIVASSAARSELSNKPQILSDIIGTSEALQHYELTQDILARAMAEAIEAGVTGGTSLSKSFPKLVWGTVRSQLLKSPRTLFAYSAQTGLKKSLDEYKQLETILPPADSSALDITTLENVKNLYSQAQALDLPNEALASALMPKSASELTNQALSSVMSELIPGLPSANEAVTLGALLQLQKSLAEAGKGLPALQKYSENLNLVLNLSAANDRKIGSWVKEAAEMCSSQSGPSPKTPGLSIPGPNEDSATDRNLIGQNWYCTVNNNGIYRFVFGPNGTFTSAFFAPTPKKLKYWDSTAPIRYAIVSPTEIKILDSSFNPPFFKIRSLSPEELRFSQGDSSYACSHVPPPEDTPENAAAVAAERAGEKKFFDGKWVTKDRLQSVEFFSDGTCVMTSREKENTGIDITMDKGTMRAKSSLYSGGTDITCGNEGGAFSRVGPNRIDFSIMRDSVSLYRLAAGLPNIPKRPTLTLALAQKILSQQINSSTVSNTLLTCRACYDPDDKEDNDKAPLVSTYSAPLNDFLMKHGYIRASTEKDAPDSQVFTAKAKRSKYYGRDGLRVADLKNPHILVTKIADPKHVPVEYDLVPTELTMGFFGRIQKVRSFASFSYENEAWEMCLGCGR